MDVGVRGAEQRLRGRWRSVRGLSVCAMQTRDARGVRGEVVGNPMGSAARWFLPTLPHAVERATVQSSRHCQKRYIWQRFENLHEPGVHAADVYVLL